MKTENKSVRQQPNLSGSLDGDSARKLEILVARFRLLLPQLLSGELLDVATQFPGQFDEAIRFGMFNPHGGFLSRTRGLRAVAEAQRDIREDPSRLVTLAERAARAGLSPFYFCKLFRRIAGVNLTDVVARTRINRAKNLLLNPHYRIKEIAYEAGFQSLTHFNRTFKRLTNETPTSYRKCCGL
jgi:AraC-like DNA-binding protein